MAMDSRQPHIIAPSPLYPEKTPAHYERKLGVNVERQGPLRFQEGIGTDTDVPADFVVGVQQGHATYPGRNNRNIKVDTKYPAETMAQRAHVGSAAWITAADQLGEFAHGAHGDHGAIEFERRFNPYQRVPRPNPARVLD